MVNEKCGDMDANRDILQNIGDSNGIELNKKTSTILKIPKERIIDVYESFDALNKEFIGKNVNKIITAGSFVELMVCSLLGLNMLSGTTTPGPDAVLLKDLKNGLKRGRYQIKYRDEDTSDIIFRVDVDERGKLKERYVWDYLLIATHPAKKKNYSIRPNNFYMIPLKEAIMLSERLGKNNSEKGKYKYHTFRINWKSDRKGEGNVGSKRDCITRKYKLPEERLEFKDVNVVKYDKIP